MGDIYKKQDSHKTDKWGNIVSKKDSLFKSKERFKTYDKKSTLPPINNPFKDIFGDIFPGFKDKNES